MKALQKRHYSVALKHLLTEQDAFWSPVTLENDVDSSARLCFLGPILNPPDDFVVESAVFMSLVRKYSTGQL